MVRSSSKPLEQVCRRLMEMNLSDRDSLTSKRSFTCDVYGEHENDPVLPQFILLCKQFRQMAFNGFKLSCQKYSKANSYCIIKEKKVVEVQNIISIDSNITIGMEFLSFNSSYTYPIDSKELSIFIVTDLSELQSWPLNDVKGKCILRPLPNSADIFVSLHLLHTL